jgi:hypothetical protein
MTGVGSVSGVDAVVETYVADVLDAIEEVGRVAVVAAYLLGSVASGTFDPARSDLDVVVVIDRALEGGARRRFIDAAGRLGCPFRALELAVYIEGRQPPHFDLNLNVTASAGAVEEADEPAHWFVIDAATAQEGALPFGADDPWSAHFEPVPDERLREALAESIAWSERQPPENEFARLNAIRSRHYLEHGEWMTKQEASR